jgi:plastocyanin
MNIKENEPTTHTEASQARLFAQQPRSAFGKLSAMALLGAALASGLLAITIGFPANTALLLVTGGLLGGAGLATIRWRWMPLLITLLSGLFLYEELRAPFVLYHLTDPKGHGFFFFLMDVLIIAFTLITLGASLGAVVQNYRQGERQVSGPLPTALTGLVAGVAGMLLGAILIGALAQPGPSGAVSTGTTSTNGVPTVHMNAANFTQSSVTIAKGSKLLLVDDVSVTHILANGSWQNGTATPANEPGAAKVSNVQVNDNSVEIGPFTTAGTYHIYCTVHQGMNLTIVVQ